MKINLSDLSSDTLELILPNAEQPNTGQPNTGRLNGLRGLSGLLTREGETLRVSDRTLSYALIDELNWLFGSVTLLAGGPSELKQANAELELSSGLKLSLAAESLTSPLLEVHVGSVDVSGNAEFQQFGLWVRDGEGQISADACRFAGLIVRLGDVTLSAPSLTANRLVISWGAAGFQLQASEVDASTLNFTTGSIRASAETLRADQLRADGADWSLAGLSFARASVDLDQSGVLEQAKSNDEPAQTAHYQPDRPLFDWQLLDQLSGRFDVDVDVDIALPIVGGRRARHPLRIVLEDGALNFRELESDLALLEGTLLDFAVRDGDLVLQLGLPFLPLKGLRKTLVRWPLTKEQLRLASRDRVRLATLAQPKVSGGPKRTGTQAAPKAPGPVHLERLGLKNIDLDLVLRSSDEAVPALLRSLDIGQLRVSGSLVHSANGVAADTEILASLSNLAFDVDDFPLSGRRFDLRDVSVNAVSKARLGFTGTRLSTMTLELQALVARSVDIGKFAED